MGVSVKTNPWLVAVHHDLRLLVGIAHSGTLISAILFLLRARWRTSIFRASEAMTVIAVMTPASSPSSTWGGCGGLLPAALSNQRELWPNFKSPLIWDVFAISTYFTISAIFFFIGMIPTRRDPRSGAGWRRRSTASSPSAGAARTGVAELPFGLRAVRGAGHAAGHLVHSVVSWDFAMSSCRVAHDDLRPVLRGGRSTPASPWSSRCSSRCGGSCSARS